MQICAFNVILFKLFYLYLLYILLVFKDLGFIIIFIIFIMASIVVVNYFIKNLFYAYGTLKKYSLFHKKNFY